MPPIIIAGAIAAAGAIGGAAIGSSASGKAAETQATAADRASQLTAETAAETLDWQKEMWNQILAIQKPYQEAGVRALGQVESLAGAKPWTEEFVSPTGLTEQNDPGYQERVRLGQQSIERAAASKGNVLNPSTILALQRRNQTLASEEFGDVYNRALQSYMTRYNTFAGERTNAYNEQANIAGMGQQSANLLSNAGQSSVNAQTGIATTSAAQQNQENQAAAHQRASGYATGANLWGNTIGQIGQIPLQAYLMNQMYGTSGLTPEQIATRKSLQA